MNINNHYDISKYIYNLIKDRFKYDDIWFYLNQNGNWIEDKNQLKLKTEIMTSVVNNIIIKSIELINDDYNSTKLITLSIKLKNINYIKLIISELKQFY